MNKTTKKVLYGVAIFTGMAVAGVKIASTMQKKQCRNDEKNPFEGKRVIFVKNEEDIWNWWEIQSIRLLFMTNM